MKYVAPEMELKLLMAQDVITTSTPEPEEDGRLPDHDWDD